MAEQTGIPWCDHTFNPWWGCEKVSPGCARCYAETLARRRSPDLNLWGPGHDFRFFLEAHWKEPLKWNQTAGNLGIRKRVFAGSMCDVFEGREELEEPRLRLHELIRMTPHLDWLVLTKRPEAMRDWLRCVPDRLDDGWRCEFPLSNLWLGVTIENARFTYRADILREIPAAVRFISAEPLLGSLYPPVAKMHGLPPYPGDDHPITNVSKRLDLTGIDQVIVGCESGPGHRGMELAWVRELRDACLTTVLLHGAEPYPRPAFFFKQAYENGRKVECPELDGRQWMEFPRPLRSLD